VNVGDDTEEDSDKDATWVWWVVNNKSGRVHAKKRIIVYGLMLLLKLLLLMGIIASHCC